MASSLSKLGNNLSEGIYKINKINTRRMMKKVKLVELHTEYTTDFLNTQILKTI